jgi:oligopeptide/dipeptide ABC transporter ATP-binding protein
VEGEIKFQGHDLRQLTSRQLRAIQGRELAMIFQDPLATLNPAFPVGEQIRESLRLHQVVKGGGWPWPFDWAQRKQEKQQVLRVMDEVGIPSPMDRYAAYPHEFSGGMQQRALIAIALACGPSLLLADEPTTALDVTIQAQILDLMRHLNRERNMAIILVTHDLGVAAEFCDTVAVMYAGRIVEQGPMDEVIEHPQHPYTQGLLRCRPHIGLHGQKLEPIPGNVPDLAELPAGCAFAARCEHVQPVCEQGAIPLVTVNSHHTSRCLKAVQFWREPDWQWGDRVVRHKRVSQNAVQEASGKEMK